MIVRRPQAALVGFRWSMGRATHHVPWGGCAVGVVRPEEECGAPRHLTHGGEANALYRQPAKEAQGTCCGEGQGGGGGGGGGRGHTRGRARDCSAPLPVAAGRRSCGQRRAAASGVRRGMVARQQHHPGESPPSHIHRFPRRRISCVSGGMRCGCAGGARASPPGRHAEGAGISTGGHRRAPTRDPHPWKPAPHARCLLTGAPPEHTPRRTSYPARTVRHAPACLGAVVSAARVRSSQRNGPPGV